MLVAVSSTAYAGVLDVPDNAGPVPDPALRFDAGLGFRFGGFEAGSSGDFLFGLEPQVAARYDRWSVVGRWSINELERTDGDRYAPTDGYLTRFGSDLRYAVSSDRVLATSKRGKPVQWVRGDVWLGAGLGREHVDWHRGDPTDRTDLALEVGASNLVRFGANHGAHAMFSGMLELDIARPPLDRVAPMHSAHDHSVMFSLSAVFGD